MLFLRFMLSKTNFDGKGKRCSCFYAPRDQLWGKGNVFLAFDDFRNQLSEAKVMFVLLSMCSKTNVYGKGNAVFAFYVSQEQL